MANIVLLSLYDRNAYGLRVMCASLKRAGHSCHMIFLKRYDNRPSNRLDLEVGEYPWQGIAKSGTVYKYASNSQISDHELNLLDELVTEINPDMIGMTVNTPLRVQANRVTRFLKGKTQVPIVWGGYDPTVNIRDCLELCDYTCIGEGDQTILDMAQRIDEGRSFDDVPNLGFIRDGKTVINGKHPVEKNLDSYPWRDNTPDFKYLIEDERLDRNHAPINDYAPGTYQTMSARGCPYKCSYCCEATFKDLYAGEVFLRRRTPQDVVAELADYMKDHEITRVHFEDEIFAMNYKWLEEFVPLYKQHVGRPFTAYIYPSRNIENILTLMKSAGLDFCCLALESGSERINKKVFDRVYDRELFLKTARLCRSLGIKFYTDVITYNPYEEEEDLYKTLDVLLETPGSYTMCVNKLFVLPGTRMAEQMKKDGMVIGPSEKDKLFNFYCRLFWIASYTRHARAITHFFLAHDVFRRNPWLVRPDLLEFVFSPLTAVRSLVAAKLPASWLKALAKWRNSTYALATPESKTRADPVCS